MLAHLQELIDVTGEVVVASLRTNHATFGGSSLLKADAIGVEVIEDGKRFFIPWSAVDHIRIDLGEDAED